MDLFGRLPNDVLSQIKYLYELPIIELFIDNIDPIMYLDVNIQSNTIRFRLMVTNEYNTWCFINGSSIGQGYKKLFNILIAIKENKLGDYDYVINIQLNKDYIFIANKSYSTSIKIVSTKDTRQSLYIALNRWYDIIHSL